MRAATAASVRRGGEIRALGRILNCVADLAMAQLAVMNAQARGHDRRVKIAERRVSRCMQRPAKAALALDRVLGERRDEDGRRRLVEGALRLTENV